MARVVILGLGTGGFAALLSARKYDPHAEIIVVDEKPFDLLHVCGLPYALEGIMPLESLKHDIGAARMGVKTVRARATRIDAAKKVVSVRSAGREEEIQYDSLIIATGASPVIPAIPGVKELLGKKVFTVYTLEDTMRLDKVAAAGMRAVVVGAGPIGLEAAVALRKKGLEVTVIEAMGHALPKSLDPDMSGAVENYLKGIGIGMVLGSKVEAVGESSVTASGKEFGCDVVVMSVGIRPSVELASCAGAQLGEKGVKVDEFLQTTAKGVYTVGDAAEVPNMVINGKPMVVGLANSAYIQGMIAGRNALGAAEKYSGTSITFATVLGELEVASTGFNMKLAESHGIRAAEGRSRGKNKYDWYPGSGELTVKILLDADSGKIIGAQAVGKDAYVRINAVSAAIRAGLTADALLDVEFAYCPPLSEAYDILLIAAELANRKIRRKA